MGHPVNATRGAKILLVQVKPNMTLLTVHTVLSPFIIILSTRPEKRPS